MLEMESMESKEDVQSTGVPQSVLLLCLAVTRVTSTSALFLISLSKLLLSLCPQMCDAGIENPKKNVWLNKSIYPLNKTLLLGKKVKNTFLLKRQNPKKNVFTLKISPPTDGHTEN